MDFFLLLYSNTTPLMKKSPKTSLWSLPMLFLLRVRSILFFALPLIAGQIGHILFSVADTVFVGNYGTEHLAALGIANALSMPLLIIGLGITQIISPFKARDLARGVDISPYRTTSLYIGLCIGVGLMVAQILLTLLIPFMGFDPAVTPLIQRYILIVAPSSISALLFQVLKENLQAMGKNLLPNMTILGFNLFNTAINYILIFNCDMGSSGAALATAISRTLMIVPIWIYANRHIEKGGSFSAPLAKEILKKGIPLGFSIVITASMFSFVTLIAGRISTIDSAANNIIITISSLTYMIPYSLSAALSVKVGHFVGSAKRDEIKPLFIATIFLGLTLATINAIIFFIFSKEILQVATSDTDVLAVASALLITVGFYQIPDTIQCVSFGLLRGKGITKGPLALTSLIIWGLGVPLCLLFAFIFNLGALGLWFGMTAALSILAVSSLIAVKIWTK